MENNPQESHNKPPKALYAPLTPEFGPKPTDACSLSWCANGHYWTPQLATPGCQGCHSPIIGLRMVNCPVCNEPVAKTRLRIDHLGGSHAITKVCQNQHQLGMEYLFVEIDHKHDAWTASQDAPTDPATQTITKVDRGLRGPGQ